MPPASTRVPLALTSVVPRHASSGPVPESVTATDGRSRSPRRSATSPPGGSSNLTSAVRTLACGSRRRFISSEPARSCRSTVSSAESTSCVRLAAPVAVSSASSPATGAESRICGSEMAPSLMASGGAGILPPACASFAATGRLSIATFAALMLLMSIVRSKSAARFQSTSTPSSSSQMPSLSATVIRSTFGLAEKTPSSPDSVTCRSGVERSDSRYAENQVRPSSFALAAPAIRPTARRKAKRGFANRRRIFRKIAPAPHRKRRRGRRSFG